MSAAVSATIHALVAHAGMTDEQYRQMLEDRFHVSSSKALTPAQADELIRSLRELLPAAVRAKFPSSRPLAGTRKRYENLGGRPDKATPAQLRMLEAAFVDRSYAEDLQAKQHAFRTWLMSHWRIPDPAWIPRDQVGPILKAIGRIPRQPDTHESCPSAPSAPHPFPCRCQEVPEATPGMTPTSSIQQPAETGISFGSPSTMKGISMAKKDRDGNWLDPRGKSVPEEYVKPDDKARDAVVERVIKDALKLEAAMIEAKLRILQEVDAYLKDLAKSERVKEGWKGNITLYDFSGRLRVERSMDDVITFSEQLQMVKTLIDEWISQRLKGIDPALAKVISQAFNVDKKNRINTAAIMKLLTLDIDDAKWRKAMRLLKESIQVTATRQYFKFLELVEEDGKAPEWRAINLNFSSLSIAGVDAPKEA